MIKYNRKRALDLVFSLANESNIKNLTKEMLGFLEASENDFKPEMTGKICMLI